MTPCGSHTNPLQCNRCDDYSEDTPATARSYSEEQPQIAVVVCDRGFIRGRFARPTVSRIGLIQSGRDDPKQVNRYIADAPESMHVLGAEGERISRIQNILLAGDLKSKLS